MTTKIQIAVCFFIIGWCLGVLSHVTGLLQYVEARGITALSALAKHGPKIDCHTVQP
jgi:hypothetical protein